MNIKTHIQSLSVILLLSVLSIAFASLRGYNSDSLYSYSQAKDLLQFGSLSGWTFPAISFLVPDVILSLPFAAILDNPYNFLLASSPIQIILFIYLFSLYYTSNNTNTDFPTTFTIAAISAAAIAILGSVVFRDVFYFMVEPFFILVHHGFAASFAVLIFLYAKHDVFLVFKKHYFLSALGLFLLIVSDFYFAFYFGFLIISTFSKTQWRKTLVILVAFSAFSIAIFLASYLMNPSLGFYANNSLNATNDSRASVFMGIVFILVLPTIFVVRLWQMKSLTEEFKQLYIAFLLIAFAIFFMGLIADKYAFRYLTIAYPISIVLCTKILLSIPERYKKLLLCFCFLFVLSLTIYANFLKEKPGRFAFHDEIKCIQEMGLSQSTIVADYWPAKMIFESTNRQYNLIQVDGNLNERNWVNNSRWKTLYADNGITFVITDQLSKDVISRLNEKKEAQSLCGGKVLLIRVEAASI
ncbi:MAG: hypothetical protein H6Q76_373, partial [Firmicutes bacterium]|nr:hypothetical protein [Bacillota bacterium]